MNVDTSLLSAVDRAVRDAEAEGLALLRATIRTPSLTGDEGRHTEPGTVAHVLWESLAGAAGVTRHADEVEPGRESIIATVGDDPRRVVVLDAHTDTVPPGSAEQWWGGDPFAASDGTVTYLGNDRVRLEVGGESIERPIRRRLGRLWETRGWSSAPVVYGRGSFDNKGPVAVAWLATVALGRMLQEQGLRLSGTLVTGFVIDEEQDMSGAIALAGGDGCWLDRHGLWPTSIGPDGYRSGIWGVALDGSYGFVPVVGHRGIAQLVVKTRGQAAHAATPSLGVNAVTRMAEALHVLDRDREAIDAELAGLFADALLEPATLALGTTIVGGGIDGVDRSDGGRTVLRTGVNVVPDWCEATIDCRHPRPADGDVSTIRERIAAGVRAAVLARTSIPAEDIAVEVLGGGPPCAILASPEAGPSDELVGEVLRHGAAVSGFAPWVETCPGGTDATVMINKGRVKSIVEFGPAGAFAHEPHEYVERDQIAVGAAILARTIVSLLGVEPAS